MEHIHRVDVRFGDCDPAGIVYFPRFFDYFHQAMETWFTAIGHPYDQVIHRGLGFPAVHTEADFRAPSRFGETVFVHQQLGRIGGKSIAFEYRVSAADSPIVRVTGKTVCAVLDLTATPGERRAVDLPADLVSAMSKWIA